MPLLLTNAQSFTVTILIKEIYDKNWSMIYHMVPIKSIERFLKRGTLSCGYDLVFIIIQKGLVKILNGFCIAELLLMFK